MVPADKFSNKNRCEMPIAPGQFTVSRPEKQDRSAVACEFGRCVLQLNKSNRETAAPAESRLPAPQL
jgi:hypothetical protein